MSKLDDYKGKVKERDDFERKLADATNNRTQDWFLRGFNTGITSDANHSYLFWRYLAKYVLENRDTVLEYIREQIDSDIAKAKEEAIDEAIHTLRTITGRAEQ